MVGLQCLRVVALACAFSVSYAAAEAQQRSQPLPTLIGDEIRSETATEMSAVVGRFVSLRGGPVAARVGGAIDNVYVDVGDRVTAGQPMVGLDQSRLVAERDRRRAMLALASAKIGSAKASLRLASQAASRLARLRNSAAFSEALLSDKQREAERAAAEVKEAEADYARAAAELKVAELELDFGAVKAPYDGVVAERHVDVGAYVSLGAPVVTLVGDKALEIEAEAPTDRMAGVKPGALAEVSYGGVAAKAPVRAVLPRETGVSRTLTVRFGPLPAELEAVAIANAAVTVDIPATGGQSVVTVHKDAIVRRPSGPIVVVAAPAGGAADVYQADMREVRLGPAVGQRLVVFDGVAPGEAAVIRGNETLRPGQRFKLAARKDNGTLSQ